MKMEVTVVQIWTILYNSGLLQRKSRFETLSQIVQSVKSKDKTRRTDNDTTTRFKGRNITSTFYPYICGLSRTIFNQARSWKSRD